MKRALQSKTHLSVSLRPKADVCAGLHASKAKSLPTEVQAALWEA